MFGVVRREILQQTSLLPNFAGSDRAMLAELAPLGRFRCANERLFLKRFHANVSWALDHEELKVFLSPDGKRYSRRLRQIKAFFGAPRGKPIGFVSKSICVMLVAAHGAKVVVELVGQGDFVRQCMATDGQGRVAGGYARLLGDLLQVCRLAPHMSGLRACVLTPSAAALELQSLDPYRRNI